MRNLANFWLAVPLGAVLVLGCRGEKVLPAPGVRPPADPPAAGRPADTGPSAPALSHQQDAALERIRATGAEVELDGGGLPVRIDLASERVFADEQLVRAALEFPGLKVLRLAVSSVPPETLAGLDRLVGLEELYLQDAPLGDREVASLLGSLPGLRRLGLRRLNAVTDAAMESVVACTKLEVLALIEMNQLSGTGLGRLAACPRLRSLDLRNSGRLQPADFVELTKFPSLVEVKLGGPAVNDRLASILIKLPRVESIAVEDAEITPAFLEELAAGPAAARIRWLAFARCFGVTDKALETLGGFRNLENLALRDIMVTGAFLESLGKAGGPPLPWKSLVLTNGFLNDEAVELLPRLAPGLRQLDLRGNVGLSPAARRTLESIPNLEDLKLEGENP
ncbi:MAG: leucine-rich repeat domain-containing protein [Thermoguttaceae bacterium]